MSVNQALKAVEEQIAQMPSSPALQASLKNMQKRFGGHFSNVRGALGEIYLEHWDDWKLLRKSLKEIAKRDARKLGKDWQPLSFSGGAWIDGKLAWDEGNLLIKVPSASDRYPLAAIHTAAQLKVANKVEAIKQTILDRIRERGLSLEPPKLTIIQEGEIRMFVLIAPPPSINVHRYLFYAEGGRIPLSHFNQLKTLGLRVDGTPLDISIEGFNALTRQMLDVAEEYLKRVASGK